MRRLQTLLLAITAALIPTFSYAIFDDSCCPPWSRSDDCATVVAFSGDLLNWRARKCELDYAIPYDGSDYAIGKLFSVLPGWNGGFRIGAAVGDPDGVMLGVRYTNFRDHTTSTTIYPSGQLAATRINSLHRQTGDGQIRYAQGRYAVSLDRIEIEGTYHLPINEMSRATLFGGFKLAILDQKFRAIYAQDSEDIDSNNIDRVFFKSNMDAYGLYFGVSGEQVICDGLGLFGKASVAALVGGIDRAVKMDGQSGGASFTTRVSLDDFCKRVVTNLDMAVGGYFSFCGVCHSFWTLKIGYDFSHWFNTSDFIGFRNIGNNNFLFDRNSDSIGFDGLFVSLEAVF